MNIKDINIKILTFIFLAGLVAIQACKEEPVYPRTRLFQPVLNEQLYAEGNSIVIDMAKMKDAIDYTVEVSVDSFQTIEYMFETDTNFVVINEDIVGEELLWYFIYQVRVTAHADDEDFNSLPSDLGSVRTEKYPSNMGTPTYFDVLDTKARVFWTNEGENITRIKVYAGDDYRLTTPIKDTIIPLREQGGEEFFIEGLTGSTTYQVAIYSQKTLRGWEQYTTRSPGISGDNVVDLSGLESPVNFLSILPDLEDGSILLLEGGTTYLASGFSFNKSVSFVAGYSFVPELPIIDCAENFNLVMATFVDSLCFKDIEFIGTGDGFNSKYIFNIDVVADINVIKFEGCVMSNLRGIVRFKDLGPGVLDKFIMSDCRVDSIREYGICNTDVAEWKINDIHIENSTFSKCVKFLRSKNNTNSITVDACTFNEVPQNGRQLFEWPEIGQDEVTNVSITNSIFGHGWNMAGEDDVLIDGFKGMASTNWTIVNTYATGDFGYGEGKNEIPGFPTATYTGTAGELWSDPYNAIFDFIDSGFSGKGDAGDPRWRIGL